MALAYDVQAVSVNLTSTFAFDFAYTRQRKRKQMLLPTGTTVAVADGEKLSLFRNFGAGPDIKLAPIEASVADNENHGSGARHQSSAANPDDKQQAEDSFAVGIVELLNKQVLQGAINGLVVIAAPRTLGELRKHYHAKLSDVLLKEIPKDLTGHTTSDIERAIVAA